MKSIIQTDKTCWFCGTTQNLHCHHIFPGVANRKKSEQHGMKAYLCGMHHNLSNESVHFNRDMDLMLKKHAQQVFEDKIGTRDYFIKEFGKSFL